MKELENFTKPIDFTHKNTIERIERITDGMRRIGYKPEGIQ